MKGLVLALTLTLGAVAWQAVPSAPSADSGPAVMAGIHAGGAPRSDCVQLDSDRRAGCESDEFRPITAGIDAGGRPHSDCVEADSDWLAGCESDELRRITVASIDGSD